MTYEEQEKRRERMKRRCILIHPIAEQATSFEGITFSEAIGILDSAKNIVRKNMESQRAHINPEIRDDWGVLIGTSGTKVPDVEQ